jgi:cellulose synthase (UDP-forming)
MQYRALTVLWIAATLSFWVWWLPGHAVSTPMFVIAALATAYVSTILPSFYWYFVGRAKAPEAHPAPEGMRVAVITPCVPSAESSDIVARQLEALSRLDYPCDVWLLDEGDDPELAALCERYGAHHFSRKGRRRWNQAGPPFKAKTKAGNVNAWLDHVIESGLHYDVFVQFDIDHRPHPDYLDWVLGYFEDPEIGWVQAPSVSGNLEYWTARGQAEQETALQGPLQMGFYGNSSTPFIIGSHTSYRMQAIREIGGYQPTRAEDHLDTVVLAAHGYRGVYVPRVIAVGDGPTTFSTYLGQQFAWAYSMAQILFEHTPHLLKNYSRAQAFQFLMAQSWYTLWSLACLTLWALPLVSLVSGVAIADVRISDFLIHYIPVVATATAMWWWSRSLFQPRFVRWSWRWLVLEAARWPIVLWAIVNAVLHVQRPYMITPKGSQESIVPSGMRLYAPYLAMTWLALGAIAIFVLAGMPDSSAGYLWLALLNAVASISVIVIASGIEAGQVLRDAGPFAAIRARGPVTAVMLGTFLTLGMLLILTAPRLAESMQ